MTAGSDRHILRHSSLLLKSPSALFGLTHPRGSSAESLVPPHLGVELEMANDAELKEVRERAIDACYNEYKELIATWRNLETKAQGNITIAGIFIAGAFAYISKASDQPFRLEKAIFGLTILLLMASVFFALLALRIRQIDLPPLGEHMVKDAMNICKTTEANYADYARRIFNLHAWRWGEANTELKRQNVEKGARLWLAQRLLWGAIGLAASLTLYKTFIR